MGKRKWKIKAIKLGESRQQQQYKYYYHCYYYYYYLSLLLLLLVIVRFKKKNKWKKRENKLSDAKLTTHHLPWVDWHPATSMVMPPKTSCWVICLVVSSPSLLQSIPVYSPGDTEWETEGSLTLCKHWSTIAWRFLFYQNCFGQNSKTKPHMSCSEDCFYPGPVQFI